MPNTYALVTDATSDVPVHVVDMHTTTIGSGMHDVSIVQ